MIVHTFDPVTAALMAAGVVTVTTDREQAPAHVIGQRVAIRAGRMPDWLLAPEGWIVSVGGGVWLERGMDGLRVQVHFDAVVASGVLAASVPILNGDVRSESYPPDGFYVGGGSEPYAFLDSAWETDRADQLPYGDFSPGRWAHIWTDVAATTTRCPACWGEPGTICFRCMGLRTHPPIRLDGTYIWTETAL